MLKNGSILNIMLLLPTMIFSQPTNNKNFNGKSTQPYMLCPNTATFYNKPQSDPLANASFSKPQPPKGMSRIAAPASERDHLAEGWRIYGVTKGYEGMPCCLEKYIMICCAFCCHNVWDIKKD